MQGDFAALEKALQAAESRGAREADAFLEKGSGLTIRVFGGEVEKFSYTEERGIGVRVFVGGRPGRAYSTELSPGAIETAVESAVAMAGVMPEDPDRGIPEPLLYPDGASDGELLGENLRIWGGDPGDTSQADKIRMALEMEERAMEQDSRVKAVETSVYGEGSGRVLLANSRGFRAGYRSSICYGYLMAIAREGGDSSTGFGFSASHSFGGLDAAEAASEAARKAVDLLGSRQVDSARVPVLLDNICAAELLEVVAAALSGEAAVKGRSFLAGKEGERVASDTVTVIDDGLLAGGYGTVPFDAEGVAARSKTLIGGGRLESYLHNCYTASRMGTATTGNAGRSSFRSQVGVSSSNLRLSPGSGNPSELLAGIEEGFQVVELQGAHAGLNPVTGEVSVGAKGLWIRHGEPAFAVSEVTIAGELHELLKSVTMVGDDLRYPPHLGGTGSPSIVLEGITVGGR